MRVPALAHIAGHSGEELLEPSASIPVQAPHLLQLLHLPRVRDAVVRVRDAQVVGLALRSAELVDLLRECLISRRGTGERNAANGCLPGLIPARVLRGCNAGVL